MVIVIAVAPVHREEKQGTMGIPQDGWMHGCMDGWMQAFISEVASIWSS